VTERTRNRIAVVGFVLAGIGGFTFLLHLVHEVLTGHGNDVYTSAKGYRLNAIGVLVVFVSAAIVGIVALVMRWLRGREEQDLMSRYGQRKDNP
jgi:uncharacterized membrane protein SpoIIM required for sporulation